MLNTHSHWDHVGGNAAFEETAIHELEASIVSRDHEIFPAFVRELRSPAAIELLPESFDPDTYRVRPNPPARILREGDVIDLGGRQLKALHTPGHSPGHLTYLDAERGFLFTGDVAYPGPVFGAYWGGGPDVFAATISRLANLPGPLIVCGGHNEVAKDPAWLGWFAECVEEAVAGYAECTLRRDPVVGRVFTFGETELWFPTDRDREAVLAEITKAYADHAEAHLRADADGAAAHLAEDAVTHWEGRHETHGRQAQRDMYAELYKTMTIESLQYTTEELDVWGSRRGSKAYELGTYAMSFETEGALTTGRYRYMAVWALHMDGSWKMCRAIGHGVASQAE